MKYESKAIAATFFEEISSEEKSNKTITKFKCQCGTIRSQDLKKGYVNLISHIKDQHKDWESIMESKHIGSNTSIMQFVNKKASSIFSWLEWIIMDNLPFTFVEKQLTRKNTKLDHSISTNTLMKYLKILSTEVEKKLMDELPGQFGIIIDGWTEGTRHYIAVFACYCKDEIAETPLLAIAPPFDEENYDAASHWAFIGDVLDLYGKGLDNLIFLIGDNAPVNKSLADMLNVPFIGCASHRFNLACKKFLKPFELPLQRINKLMGVLRNIKQAGKLRKKTDLEPVKRNVTRWSSTYSMLSRFFEIRNSVDESDPDLACHLPSGSELIKLQQLMKNLNELEAITKKLQEQSCTLSDVRAIFDMAIESFPCTEQYLSANAEIVHSPDFESGIVKIIDENAEDLTELEKGAVEVFSRQESQVDNGDTPEGDLSIVEKALKLKKRKVIRSQYVTLDFIPATSNIVERLFSNARLVLTDYRKSMSPYTFECVMFLKFNRKYWDLALVSKIVGK